jgi:hypothetical protein
MPGGWGSEGGQGYMSDEDDMGPGSDNDEP